MAEFIPAVKGTRYIPEYYRAKRTAYTDGQATVDQSADASAVIHAFEVNNHPLGEIIAKAIRIAHRLNSWEFDKENKEDLERRIKKDLSEIMEHTMTLAEHLFHE